MTRNTTSEPIHGYTYGTPDAAASPLTLDELEKLKAAVGLTSEDERYRAMAGQVLAGQAEEMVTAWRAQLGEHLHLAIYSAHPDGTPNPAYSVASKPRFVQWVIDACTRPFDQAWLDYQHEIGLRHTREKKNVTDKVDSVEHIPMRYVLAFTAVVITSARGYLAAHGHTAEEVEAMHAAWTKSVLLHVTTWTRPYAPSENW
jgi:hypothetical protein